MNHAHLSNIDLLGKLIGMRKSRQLYKGTLHPLFSQPPDAESAHEKCAAARELVKRWLEEELRSADALTSPRSVRDYLRLLLHDREHEVFVVLLLDAQHRVIACEELFRGTLTQTSVYPREVVKAALRANAAAVIFAHNHPSGVAEPSHADELLTRSLKAALALVDIQVLDHFIVAGTSTLSFAERGLL
jgi:DNA repair protein RadC